MVAMRVYSAAILAVLMVSVTSVFSATLDPLWASGVRGPDPSLVTPECVEGGDCNMCKFYDWLVNRQNCDEDVVSLHSTYCERTDDYFSSLSYQAQEYVTAVKACHIKALIPYYGTSAGTCSNIETTAQLSWFGTQGTELTCLFQQGFLCDIIKNDADLEVFWLIFEECATPPSEAIITFIRGLAKDKCDAAASNNLEQFVEDKFNAPDPVTDAPAVDPWTQATVRPVDPWTQAPVEPVDPWTQAPGNPDPWTNPTANPDPWPTTRKPNRWRPNRPNKNNGNKNNGNKNRPNKNNGNKNRPNKNNGNKNRPNKNNGNKNRPNKNNGNKNRPNKRPNNNNNNGNPPPSNYNLHYWK